MQGGLKSSWYQGPVFRAFMIGLIFCLIFGITYRLNQTYLQKVSETALVVAARRMLPPGTLLTDEDLIVKERPLAGLGEDYCQDISALLKTGEWYTDTIGLGEGDVLRPSRLVKDPFTEESLLQRLRKEQKCLIAVETDLVQSCGNWLSSGTRADAWVYISGKDGPEKVSEQVVGPLEDPCLGNLLIVDKKNKNALPLETMDDAAIKDPLPVVLTLMVEQNDEERIRALIRYNEIGKIYFSPKSLEK